MKSSTDVERGDPKQRPPKWPVQRTPSLQRPHIRSTSEGPVFMITTLNAVTYNSGVTVHLTEEDVRNFHALPP